MIVLGVKYVKVGLELCVTTSRKEYARVPPKEKLPLVNECPLVLADAQLSLVLTRSAAAKWGRRLRIVEREPGRQLDGHFIILGPGIMEVDLMPPLAC